MHNTRSIFFKMALLFLVGFTTNSPLLAEKKPETKKEDNLPEEKKEDSWIEALVKDAMTKIERAEQNAFRQKQQAEQARLDKKKEWLDKISTETDPAKIAVYNDQIKQIDRVTDEQNRKSDENETFAKDMLGKAANVLIDNQKEELAKQRNLELASAKTSLEQKGALARTKAWISGLTAPETMGYIALASIGIIAGYYGTKLAYQYIEARMGKPKLVRDSSRIGFFGWVKNQIYPTTQTRQLEDIVVSPDIETKIRLLSEDLFETNSYGLPYQNALFYGPPGTGKTEMAKTLAYLSGMDYAILSGADFAQFKNGEDITELHKLFDWANNSERGLILFIDEADACFRDRSTLSKEGVDLVNAFLSQTGSSSDKIMIILATNYEDELDAAVRSRINKKIPFLLPEQAQRGKIVKQKIKKYISNDTRTYLNKDNEPVEASLTMDKSIDDKYINEIAQKIENFSGRDIDQAISEMRLRAYRSGKNILTKEIVEYVVNDKIQEIKKDKLATDYQRQRKTKATA